MIYLSVRNWRTFQHYGNRNPPWVKLHTKLLETVDFEALADVTKAHLMLIWLLAGRTDNLIPADARWIARKIGANEPVDLEALVRGRWLVPAEEEDDSDEPNTDASALMLAPDASTRQNRDRDRDRIETEVLSLSRQPPTTRGKKKPPALDEETTEALLAAYRGVHPHVICRALPPDAIRCIKQHRGTEYEVTPERLATVAAWTLTWKGMDPTKPPKPGNLLRATRWGNYVVEAEEWNEAGRPSSPRPGTRQSSEPSWVEEYNNVSR